MAEKRQRKPTARVTGNLPRAGSAQVIVFCDDAEARKAALESAANVAPSDMGLVSTASDRVVFSGASHDKLKELLFAARDNAKYVLRQRGFSVGGSLA